MARSRTAKRPGGAAVEKKSSGERPASAAIDEPEAGGDAPGIGPGSEEDIDRGDGSKEFLAEALANVDQDQLASYLAGQGYELVDAAVTQEDLAHKQNQDELDSLFAQIDGLPTHSRGAARVTVDRVKPLYHEGIEVSGYCTTLPLPFSVEDVKQQFGGGTYKFSLRTRPDENDGSYAALEKTATFRIVGPPKLGSLTRDHSAQGVQLAPEINQKMDALEATIQELRDLKVPAPKASPFEKAMEAMLLAQIEKFTNPPEPAPPPKPINSLDSMREARAQLRAAKDLVDEFAVSDVPPDPDDDSAFGGMAKEANAMKTIVKSYRELVDELGEAKAKRKGRRPATTPPPPAPAQPAAAAPQVPPPPQDPEKVAMTAQERDAVLDVLQEAIELYFELDLNQKKHVNGIVAAMSKLLGEKIPEKFHALVQTQLADDKAFQMMVSAAQDEDSDLSPEERQRRLARLTSRRGKDKLFKVLRKLRGEE